VGSVVGRNFVTANRAVCGALRAAGARGAPPFPAAADTTGVPASAAVSGLWPGPRSWRNPGPAGAAPL